MGEDEEATLRTLTSHRKLIDSAIYQHHGRFVNSAGDSVLAEFASVVEAVNCAVGIQTGLKAENASLAPERRMEFRIGVNLGDVMVEGEQIYGDGVNVAARLESLAEPGGICISSTVHDQVSTKLELNYADQGEQVVKNIAKPVRVFRVLLNGEVAAPQRTQRIARKYSACRRVFLRWARDHRCDGSAGAAPVPQTAAQLRIDSTARQTGAIASEHSIDRCTSLQKCQAATRNRSISATVSVTR
jgi:hypothetical protein